ncbi:hypothetical protein C731_2081 [Mycolicibacterium hassiacum DSM 44199]|jgi:hypothetical protein|uniref:Uncharacterized protein n=1 Tax=Mycolicibacterium hassiacum (strain DSM 44199 / CIP 105218 / JCM 12690 / 3849) TaxID=1122247 RepID=K5B8L1_MYCHD|nr:hypothetical protein [Mycolicibacterium hassiacum]EKF23888.1 hypothetical protein C731_2081 [Mycolicibacterium hassiacum DSM 44199]MBX5485679.1 hypothetical protein [Mycolicibacterium hassiacum]MDA4085771.1 hypothetical protein [Mycolicibacterium hassiacum DSM 44199]PZN20527.1 MAG: hypothetical protein DIU75_12245 [Mycolicibacterium hassiacum]VCT90488.1 hypothetical protein MHAS_02193 [Mycolicibacterium hassiacum DSM 44199]
MWPRSRAAAAATAAALAGLAATGAATAWAQDPPPNDPTSPGRPGNTGIYAPQQEITLRYGPPTPIGISAFVGITHNEGRPPVNCAYHDGFYPSRPFTVTGSQETRLDILGIPLGRTYHIVVTCDGGLIHQQDKVF